MLYCRVFVHLFFPFMFAMSSYILVFFKLQDTVYLLLPRENREDGKGYEYYPVRVMLVSLWAFQTANVLKVIYDQCSVDIFFVDWERPRSETLRHKVPVSIWRTLFVANEWNELQTVRRTNVTFILFLLGWLLVGEQLENAATACVEINR
jgi:meckelin